VSGSEEQEAGDEEGRYRSRQRGTRLGRTRENRDREFALIVLTETRGETDKRLRKEKRKGNRMPAQATSLNTQPCCAAALTNPPNRNPKNQMETNGTQQNPPLCPLSTSHRTAETQLVRRSANADSRRRISSPDATCAVTVSPFQGMSSCELVVFRKRACFVWILLVEPVHGGEFVHVLHQQKVFLNSEFSTPGAKIVSILSIISDRP
jgi:hypothetical protein